jgi:alpha-galactosidase
MHPFTRRKLLTGAAGSALVPWSKVSGHGGGERKRGDNSAGFLEIVRRPDAATAFLGLDRPVTLQRSGTTWQASQVSVRVAVQGSELPIHISAGVNTLTHVHLRWSSQVPENLLFMGDAWERSYGDLRWSGMAPERVLPWYFLTSVAGTVHGYGVKTGAGAFCFWQVDPGGVSLWLDVSNGGSGVTLGDRELLAATVVARRCELGQDPMASARELCIELCDKPRLPPSPIFGSNDWYYAYGKNSAEQSLRDAELMASVTPASAPRPFTVIDDGWTDKKAFPNMAELADGIRARGVRPGLWIRPLQAPDDTADALLLPNERFGHSRNPARACDPTIPEALAYILDKVKDAVSWGYDLIKHDYSTFELFGRWGFQMGAQVAVAGWNFHDRSKTSAEIVRELYANIRRAAGNAMLIGCNTIGHLGAGLFQIQRTGDDTSGTEWERTRRMGVNTLAYRLPQHRTFFVMDADCVPITTATPWEKNRQWLDLIARSGTALFVSPEPRAIGDEQRQALREAFEIAASGPTGARPRDWQLCTTPEDWEFRTQAGGPERKRYDWYSPSGAWPYHV